MALAAAMRIGQKFDVLVVGRDENVDARAVYPRLSAGEAACGSGIATTNRLSASIITLYISAR